MSNIQIRCTNSSCHFYNNFMPWPEDVSLTVCPICGSAMEPAVSAKGNGAEVVNAPGRWLAELAEDPDFWVHGAEDAYPSVIAYEYRSLREYCRKEEPYAVLLSLKDNFEALLKLEVLLAYAWAARNMDETFEAQTVSLLTTPNLSLGAWMELASVLEKGLKKAGAALPAAIPLGALRKRYIKAEFVNWRNTKLGHGAMGMSDDEEFRQDIREKVILLKDLLLGMDRYLRNQELHLPGEGEGSTELSLTGANRARGLERSNPVFFRTRDGKTELCADPFIVIRRHQKKGCGVYFFDNQRTRSLTHFLAYAEGSRASESVGYFEGLRRKLETSGVKEEARADDPYLTEDEIRELDLLQMSHNFVKPAHLAGWLKRCLEEHDRGIFLLQMNRGTGKSVFTEKISGLEDKPLKLAGDVDVRTYHIGRTQAAGSGDILSGIEWQWSRDYAGKTWARAPRISDYEKEGKGPGEALCDYLEEVQRYVRRNRGKEKVLMVLDGLDEIQEEELWKLIPKEEMLREGIYFLLTSRDPETEVLVKDTADHLSELSVTEKYCPERNGAENTAFLREYIKNTGLKGLAEEDMKRLLDHSDHRVLMLGMLCRLAEGGMEMAELPDSGRVVSVYLDELEKRYGEKEAIRIRELLAVLCTLGAYEGLTLGTLGALTGENGVTLRLAGTVRDLSPMLKTERSEEGNLYMIANPGLAGELMKQISETEDTVRFIIKLAMSVMRDGNLEKEKNLAPAAAHVSELAGEVLPESMEALGSDAEKVLRDNINRAKKLMTYRQSRERFLDHNRQLFIYLKGARGAKHPDTLKAQRNMTEILVDMGRYEEALTIGQDVFERSTIVLGAEHPETLKAQDNLAVTLLKQGRYEEALTIGQDAYEKRKRVLGEEHPDVLTTQSNMASILEKLGHYEEALDIQRDVYEKSKKALGAEHPDTLVAQNNLALILEELGRYEEALDMERAVYEKSKNVLGAEHPDALRMQSNMASMLEKIGRYEEALVVEREIYEKKKKVLGAEHPDTLIAQNGMAVTLYKLGRYEEALAIGREVYEKKKKVLGAEHPDTLITHSNMACILEELGRYEEALAINREVYEKRKKVLGAEHPATLRALNNLALTLDNLGRYEEALAIGREVFEKEKKVLGAEHPDTLITHSNMACILEELGRYEEALAMLRDDYERSKKVLGGEHPATLSKQGNMAWILEELGRSDEALAIEREVYEKKKKVLGGEHSDTLTALSNLALTLGSLGRYEEALAMFEEYYEKKKKVLGGEHPDTLTALTNLALTLGSLGRYEEALAMFEEYYEKKKKVLGGEHPETLIAQSAIATTLRKLKHYEEALEMFRDVYEKSKIVLGEGHHDTLTALKNVAFELGNLERYQESCATYQSVYEKMKMTLGEMDNQTLSALNDLAWTQDKLGLYEEAIRNQQELVRLHVASLGEADRRTHRSFVKLAEFYLHAGNKKKAEETVVYAKRLMEDNGVADDELLKKIEDVLRVVTDD